MSELAPTVLALAKIRIQRGTPAETVLEETLDRHAAAEGIVR